ncbi:MAG: MFS transporter [Planctomycetes bacterium]|nr:MFS transporter [Planctomycetota bacterium]
MLFRFSLYGFLKNQRYFAPFLVLIFLEKGLSFTAIGLLIGFREICINIMEVPSGAVADLYGLRRCMIASFLAYIISFLIFAESSVLWHLFIAMFFFAVGEAFRTGTHKAIIMQWLRQQERENERTKTYGFTRSWSQLGSALSVLIAVGLVFFKDSYLYLFWFSIIPCLANVINLASYPRQLDWNSHPHLHKNVFMHLWEMLKLLVNRKHLRRLITESMGYEGTYAALKDYVQPIIKTTAISLPILLAVSDRKRTAVLIALVYFILYLLSGIASRKSHQVAEYCGGEEPAARKLWGASLLIFAMMTPLMYFKIYSPVIVGFILLAILQNLWRPVQVTRYDLGGEPRFGATLLSIDSQAKSIATMLFAPLLGWAVDQASIPGETQNFWPVGLLGVIIALLVLVSYRNPATVTSN